MKIVYGSNNSRNSADFFISEHDLKIGLGQETYDLSTNILNKIESENINGKKIYQLFEYENLSFWWFIYPIIYPAVQRTLNFITKFSELLDEKKPTIVIVDSDFSKLNLIRQICLQKNIILKYSKIRSIKYLIQKKLLKKIQKIRFYKITINKIKKRKKLYYSLYDKIPDINNKVIFITPTSYRRKKTNLESLESIKGEYLQDPIVDILKKLNLEIVGIDVDYSFQGNLDVLQERLNDSIQWFPIELLLSNKTNSQKIFKIFSKIINNKQFQEKFVFEGINFWEEMEDDFEKFTLLPHIQIYIRLLNGLKQFFKHNKPLAVFLPYETGPFALSTIVACDFHKIKTIGIQHGLLWKNNSDYSHVYFRSIDDLLGMPLPDMTLLFGKFSYKILIEQGYPKNRFLVFGNPEFFRIEKIIAKLKNLDIKSKYNIPYNKKIILFATGKSQRYYNNLGGSLDYDEQVLITLLEQYCNNEKYFVIIKPHPGEYLSFYEQLLEKYNSKNFKIIEGDLFELLFISDVNISIFSTVLTDSIALNKMTIRVKFPNSTVPLPYDEYNVLVSCHLKSLSESIEMIINEKSLQDKLQNNRIEFLQDMYNLPNPNSIEQIESLVKKQID